MRNNKRTMIYSIGMISWLISALLNVSLIFNVPDAIHKCMLLIFVACMVYLILTLKISKKQLAILSVLSFMSLYSYKAGHYSYVIMTFIAVWASNGVNEKVYIKKQMFLMSFFIIIHILIFYVFKMFSPDQISYVYREGVQRYTFLLAHANTFSMIVIWIIAGYVYLNYNKLNIVNYITIIFITAFVKVYTDTNSIIVIITLMFIFIWIDKRVKKGKVIISKTTRYIFLFFTMVFIISTCIYTRLNMILKTIYKILDNLFTGRLLIGAYLYNEYGWTLFGKTINSTHSKFWDGKWFDAVGCDNTYIWCFVGFGLVYVLLIGIMFYKVEPYLSDAQKIMIILYSFYAMMEAYVLNAAFSFPILFISKYLNRNRLKTNEESDYERKRKY